VSDLNHPDEPNDFEAINEQGGSVTPSYGIDAAQKQAGIAHGIRKINQGTDSHLAWTAALRTKLTELPPRSSPARRSLPRWPP
jgi:fructose-bisphosphate aldolase class II